VKIQSGVRNYPGRRAVRLVNDDGPVGTVSGGQVLATIKESDFEDGTIEAEIAGFPYQGAKPSTRGFIGIAFRAQDHGSRYEAFYLRMNNGRADDQLRRNHSAHHVSQPEFPWNRLRQVRPGVYESYVDIYPEARTKIKIVVSGNKAQLYLNGTDQPCLIVNNLKLGASCGQIALWTGSDTKAYFCESDDSVAQTVHTQIGSTGRFCVACGPLGNRLTDEESPDADTDAVVKWDDDGRTRLAQPLLKKS
jgi:hypothetical protein